MDDFINLHFILQTFNESIFSSLFAHTHVLFYLVYTILYLLTIQTYLQSQHQIHIKKIDKIYKLKKEVGG